jgi:hypothetical protein
MRARRARELADCNLEVCRVTQLLRGHLHKVADGMIEAESSISKPLAVFTE